MDPIAKMVLKKKTLYLVEHLEIGDDLLAYLQAEEVISDLHYEEFTHLLDSKSRPQLARKLTQVLMRRGVTAFNIFLDALNHTQQKFIAEHLKAELEKQSRGASSENSSDTENPSPDPSPSPSSSNLVNPAPPPQIQSSGTGGFFSGAGYEPGPAKPTNRGDEGAFIQINLRSCDLTDSRTLGLMRDPQVYPMKQQQGRGRALIINNELFAKTANLGDRDGSLFDVVNLTELFKRLYFDVDVSKNLTSKELSEKIDNERLRASHKDADAFILVILSHGTHGYIYAQDGTKLSIEDDIVAKFDGTNCPALRGKPKLFIIQACQGADVTRGQPVSDGPVSAPVESILDPFKDLKLLDNEDSMPIKSQSHEKADMIMAYATAPGYKAWRLPDAGTWFVREFVHTVCEYAHSEHIVDILTRVRARVAEKQTSSDGFLQLTRTVDQLLKKFYFFPGY